LNYAQLFKTLHIKKMKEAIIYLLVITVAELVTVLVQPMWGMVCHIMILVAVTLHSALGLGGRYQYRHLVLSLALVPLVRIISLSMPLFNIPQIWWYPIIYTPLLVATLTKSFNPRSPKLLQA